MKKIIFVGLCAFLFSSCTISYSFTATNNPIGSKTGTSVQKFLGAIPLGGDQQDAGYQSACKNGGITKVGLAETTVTTNGFVTKKTTTVYGE